MILVMEATSFSGYRLVEMFDPQIILECSHKHLLFELGEVVP